MALTIRRLLNSIPKTLSRAFRARKGILNYWLRRNLNAGVVPGRSVSTSTPRHLFKTLDQPLALEAGEPLDPEQAVELIDLVLVADRAQTVRFLGLPVAVDVLMADPDPRVTADLVIDPWHRNAAFPMQDHLGRHPG